MFVVHGRDEPIRRAMFEFLRAVGLNPLEWGKLMQATRNAAPYVGQVLDRGLAKATAVVVLMTPDDLGQLKQEFWGKQEPPHERELTGQARLNVVFEAGMAFSKLPASTILVEVGRCRSFSDTHGRHVVLLNNSEAKRQELVEKLETAGCPVNKSANWLTTGNFEKPEQSAQNPANSSKNKHKKKKKKKKRARIW
ncbi:MAG: nucleotide-binding protein [Proteobacteria bacterium]|nr:nucleotide-binding protein [Pseudomonadota bacterium]